MYEYFFFSDDSSDSEENEKTSLPNTPACGPDVMCPTNDDKISVSSRYKKNKTNSKKNVNFEPEKYEAALRNILGVIQIIKFNVKKIRNLNVHFFFYNCIYYRFQST